MIRSMGYPQWIGAAGVTIAFVFMVLNFIQGDMVLATILLAQFALLFGALLWWARPSRGAHISHAAAQEATRGDGVIVYWRPACMHCDRLKLGLGSTRHHVSWVNIWKDAEAAEFVATHHDGHQTVPMAVTGAGKIIDATPEAIKAQLKAERYQEVTRTRSQRDGPEKSRIGR